MIPDIGNEHSSQWKVELGPLIGGPVPYMAPTNFQIIPPLDADSPMILSITGAGYTCGMAALQRPLMPVFNPAAILLTFEYELCTDGKAPSLAQAIETDLLYCDAAGYKYNGSLQNNYQQGGQIQVANAAGNWVDAGVVEGKYAPNQWHSVSIAYLISTVAHTLTYVSITIDNVVYPLGQTVAAQLMSPAWMPGVYNQLQLDLAAAGGAYSVGFKNIADVWG